MEDNTVLFFEVLKLYTELVELEKRLSTEKNMQHELIQNIMRRIKRLNKLNKDNWIFFIKSLPLEFFLSSSTDFTSKDNFMRFVRIFRKHLEKNIAYSRYSSKLHLKDAIFKENKLQLLFPMEEFNPGYLYKEGWKPVLITVPHATPPFSDKNVDKIALQTAKLSGAHVLISTISRIYVDPNRPEARITPFRRIIERLTLREGKIKVILDLHGTLRSDEEIDVEIGVFRKLTADEEIIEKLLTHFQKRGLKCELEVNNFIGGDIILHHSLVPDIQAIQIELYPKARNILRRNVIEALTEFIKDFK